MIRRPPRSTRTDTLFPYTTLFRSSQGAGGLWIDRQRKARAEPLVPSGTGALRRGGKLDGSGAPALGRPPRSAGNLFGQDGRVGRWKRSEERSVGEECVSTCRSRWSPYP